MNEHDISIIAEWTRNDNGNKSHCFVLQFSGESDILVGMLDDQFGKSNWSLSDSEHAVGKHNDGLFLVLYNERDAVEFKLTHEY